MKKITIIVLALAAALTLTYLLVPTRGDSETTPPATPKQQYTCGMHPEVISDEPGVCPICNMKLTPKKGGASTAGTVLVDPTTSQSMGIATTPVGLAKISREIRASGKVVYAEPLIKTVSLRVEAWVEKLLVDYEGAHVRKGQPLLRVYSPELVAAQQEFLIAAGLDKLAVETDDPAAPRQDLLRAARQRLANWDLSETQIERLVSAGEVSREVTVVAPSTGTIVAKNVAEGDHIGPSRELYRIVDLSSVWVVAYAYEQDLPFIELGQQADIAFPNLPGEHATAAVSYISPYLSDRAQVEIRFEVDNPNGRLRPDMYAEVTIRAELPDPRLAVPQSAVIASGSRHIVFVSEGDGVFAPRTIEVGAFGENDLLEVRSGLMAGEEVVVSGQFLLDSESRLSEAIGDIHTHDHGSHSAPETTPPSDTAGIYTCPMPVHFDVLQFGEGDCPKCGMKLVPLEDTDNSDVWVCPMRECGVVKPEPGNCDVCGMHLVKHEHGDNHDR